MDLLVVDISENTYKSVLENIGLYAYTTSGLKTSVYNWEKAKDIVASIGIQFNATSQISHFLVEIDYKKDEEDFFLDYFNAIVDEIGKQDNNSSEKELTVFFNLSYFSAGLTKFNKMVEALFSVNDAKNITSIKELPINNYVFFVGAVTQLIESDVVRYNEEITDGGKHNIFVIDNDGEVGISNDVNSCRRDKIDLDEFDIYNISQDRMRVEFKNDCFKYLGHFVLPTIHLRTYYDLGMFVKRDDTFYYYYKKFKNIIGQNKDILLCTFGFQEGSLNIIALRLKRMINKFRNSNIEFCYQEYINEYDVSKFEQVVVLCDIINSGETVKEFISQIIGAKSIVILTIASMENTPSFINGVEVNSGIVLKAKHLKPDSPNCYLCKYEQNVTKINCFEDFRRIAKDKLTPLDFWEIVKNSNAFIRSSVDNRNRQLCYRIDIPKIIDNYKCFLIKTIWSAFRNNFGRSPIDAILTVDKESSVNFAKLVTASLNGNDLEIIAIKREVLNRITPSSGLPEENPLKNKHKVLIVDNGINRGGTLYRLVNYANAANANTIGALVFDNRIDEVSLKRITGNLQGEIVTLYDWISLKKDIR